MIYGFCAIINLAGVVETEIRKKIRLTDILITVLICALFSCITIIVTTHNKSPSMVQSVNINTDKKEKINLNTATLEELKSLEGIGDKIANRIIEGRPYKNIYDLNKIEGIGEGIIKSIMEEVEAK